MSQDLMLPSSNQKILLCGFEFYLLVRELRGVIIFTWHLYINPSFPTYTLTSKISHILVLLANNSDSFHCESAMWVHPIETFMLAGFCTFTIGASTLYQGFFVEKDWALL